MADDEPWVRATTAYQEACGERKMGGEFALHPQARAEVSWPLKVTGKK
ncbi:hypothetical protein ABZ934_24145 [Streptomyces sp. NPDC046557]